MLTIICGEDTVASRAYLQEILEKYKEKEYEVQRITPDEIAAISEADTEEISLFGARRIYLVENLNKTLKRKGSEALLKSLSALTDTELITWEDGVTKRELKMQSGTIKEFKLPQSIFQFMDSCYPGNLKGFLGLLTTIGNRQNEMFLYIMLSRHMRQVLFAAYGTPLPALASWQVAKLKKQASYWDKQKLLDFYDKLIGFDITLKTGTSAYPLKDSMELLACYYLK